MSRQVPQTSLKPGSCLPLSSADQRNIHVVSPIAIIASAQISACKGIASRSPGGRLDVLQGLLDTVRDAPGEPLRQGAMERHWKAMQDYMAASLKLTVRQPAAAGSAADCQVVGGAWAGLSFPGQVLSGDYLKVMQEQMGRMRVELVDLHAARDAEGLDLALRSHWRSNYTFLQKLRGLGWMFDGWTPASPGDRDLPEPGSEGAKLAQSYCSICHAMPPARLHTATEWRSVLSTMSRHIILSDGGMPMCVQVPSAVEMEAIGGYFEKYAR